MLFHKLSPPIKNTHSLRLPIPCHAVATYLAFRHRSIITNLAKFLIWFPCVHAQNYSNCKSMLVVGCSCSCLWHETWLCLPECAEAECKVTADCWRSEPSSKFPQLKENCCRQQQQWNLCNIVGGIISLVWRLAQSQPGPCTALTLTK